MGKIEEYTKTIPSKSGKNSYKSNLKSFFRYLSPDPEHEKKYDRYLGIPLSTKQKKYVENYFKTKRDYKKDVINFVMSLNGSPPKTIKSKVAAIKGFLQYNDIELKNKAWKEINNKIQGSRAVTLDKVPSKEELKQILTFATVKDRALFLTLTSSGMRIGEACKIRLDDIKELPMIHIRAGYTKSGNSRVTFVSPEAHEAIEQWLKERDDYLRVAVTRLNCAKPRIEGKRPERIVKSRNDDRVFPYVTSTARTMWNRLLRKSDLNQRDPSSGYHSIHIHCLRKYFCSHLNIAGVPSDVIEALLGHEEKLMRIYNIYTHEQLGEIYSKAVHHLTVLESQPDLTGVHEELKEKDQQIKELQERMQRFEDLMNQKEHLLNLYEAQLKNKK